MRGWCGTEQEQSSGRLVDSRSAGSGDTKGLEGICEKKEREADQRSYQVSLGHDAAHARSDSYSFLARRLAASTASGESSHAPLRLENQLLDHHLDRTCRCNVGDRSTPASGADGL